MAAILTEIPSASGEDLGYDRNFRQVTATFSSNSALTVAPAVEHKYIHLCGLSFYSDVAGQIEFYSNAYLGSDTNLLFRLPSSSPFGLVTGLGDGSLFCGRKGEAIVARVPTGFGGSPVFTVKMTFVTDTALAFGQTDYGTRV